MKNIYLELPSQEEYANRFCNSLNKLIDGKSNFEMKEISRQLHMGYQRLSELRNNHKTLPPVKTIDKILNYFGCSFDAMISKDSAKNGPTYLEVFASYKFLLDSGVVKHGYYTPSSWGYPIQEDERYGCLFEDDSLCKLLTKYNVLSSLLKEDPDLLRIWAGRSLDRMPNEFSSSRENEDLKWTIGSRITEISTLKNVSVKELMQGLDCSQAAISQYKTGVRAPSAYTLIALARILGTSVDYLLGHSPSFYNAINRQQMVQILFHLLNQGTICCEKVYRNGTLVETILIEDPILETFCKKYGRYRMNVRSLEIDDERKGALIHEWILKNCANYSLPILAKEDFLNFKDLYQYEYHRKEKESCFFWDQSRDLPEIFDRMLNCCKELTYNHRQALNHIKEIQKNRESQSPGEESESDVFSEIFS